MKPKGLSKGQGPKNVCPSACGYMVPLNYDRECFRHRCNGSQKESSMWANTFFSGANLPPSDILNIGYYWLAGGNHKLISTVTGHSTKTITNFLARLNQLVADSVEEDSCVIGGENIIVEIDECKLAKRKYNRGHHVEGVWVIGGVEKTPDRRVFFQAVERRDAETIEGIISRHVSPGSIIRTDKWKGYCFLGSSQVYSHQTVNHSTCFKDPQTGCHTNTIEGMWSALKLKISKRYRCIDGITKHLFAFIWRRQNANSLWASFLALLTDCSDLE